MITQLWLWWHGHHSKIRFNTLNFRKHYGTSYECIVCGAERRDRKRRKHQKKVEAKRREEEQTPPRGTLPPLHGGYRPKPADGETYRTTPPKAPKGKGGGSR